MPAPTPHVWKKSTERGRYYSYSQHKYVWETYTYINLLPLTLGDALLLMTAPDDGRVAAELVGKRLLGKLERTDDELSTALRNAQSYWRKRLGSMMAHVETLTP